MVRTLSKFIMRTKLMSAKLNKEENSKFVIEQTIEEDATFLKRALQTLTNDLDDAKKALNKRLATETTVDKNVVEVMFQGIKDLEAKIKLYTEFQTFIKE